VGDFGLLNAGAFRPLPLALWWLLLRAGAGVAALHLVNILVHGTNAFLTVRLARPLVRPGVWAELAGLLVLTFPLACEPVVWCAGVFDVTATLLVLLAVLEARGYAVDDGPRRRALFFVTVGAALLSKETAAVCPLLIGADAAAIGTRSKRLLRDAVAIAAVVGLYGLARIIWSPGVGDALTRYVAQRALFQAFGGYAVPWHAGVAAQYPWMPLAYGLILVALFAWFFVERASNAATRRALAGAAWIVVTILPVFTFLFIAPDLQQSRYLYLGTVG
jgi:hypothetical protein